MSGPGTVLKNILERFGVKERVGCGCIELQHRMDNRGPAWCRENTDYILRQMKREAYKRQLPFSRIAARGLVWLAIRRGTRMGALPMRDYFERVYCVNLLRRPDRLERFRGNVDKVGWPFEDIRYVQAVDGRFVEPPSWWRAGRGAWGCYRSHARIIEECLNEGVDSVLLLEDDAVFPKDFTAQVGDFLAYVPDNWGMLYLGGQHLYTKQQPPVVVNDRVCRPYNVNRTHAFALRRRMLVKVYRHIMDNNWIGKSHIDHHLGRLVMQKTDHIYAPRKWIVGQAGGRSDISRKMPGTRFWAPADRSITNDPTNEPFVACIGLHSSGSTAVAGVLHHLGIYMGDRFSPGPWGKSYEARDLRNLCEEITPFPQTPKFPKHQALILLRRWINAQRMDAAHRGVVAGGKYPQLCRLGEQLLNTCGRHLKIVSCERPLDQCIRSLKKRVGLGKWDAVAQHQRWLNIGRKRLLSAVQEDRVCEVSYDDLLSDTRGTVLRIAEFLGIKPNAEQLRLAIGGVDPSRRHIT